MNKKFKYIGKKGISKELIYEFSKFKQEPKWMTDLRIKAYEEFKNKNLPNWGPNLSKINFNNIIYYKHPKTNIQNKWEDVPESIKNTFEDLGVPEAERKFLAGTAAQYESEVIYKKLKDKWNKMGVIYTDCSSALKEYPKLMKKYFNSVVSIDDNKFASLNSAIWSGGSFVYVPEGVKLKIPLQAYFWINSVNMGQFERTLIIAEKNSQIEYIEGCSAPIFDKNSLHAAVVEIIVKENAQVKYTTVQNWSKNIFNLTTQRALVNKNGKMYWTDANIGSKITMKYPAVILKGENSYGEILSASIAESDQIQDTGGKAIHLAKNTRSLINARSISKDKGKSIYRGLIKIEKQAKNSKAKSKCDSIIIGSNAKANSYPTNINRSFDSNIEHEAFISKISKDKLIYLQSRGVTESQANSMILLGFLNPIFEKLPMEYAIELNTLVEMSMENSIG